MNDETHELIHTDKVCTICRGNGGWRRHGEWEYCDTCGGSGFRLTELGHAIWTLAERAFAVRHRLSAEGDSP